MLYRRQNDRGITGEGENQQRTHQHPCSNLETCFSGEILNQTMP